MSWEPSEKTRRILDRGMQIIEDLPYIPTSRYVFYILHQEMSLGKDYYKNFLKLTSRARKEGYGNWKPDSLADDGRNINGDHTTGFEDLENWFNQVKYRSPKLAPILQDSLVFVGFEAAAMKGQFEHYLGEYGIPLIPFRGDPSIPFKWEIAQQMRKCHDSWPDKTIYFLYFGDYDPKGLTIPEYAIADIRLWAGCHIEYVRIGINEEQIEELGIAENFDKPGQYQWEAIPDKAAQGLLERVFDYWDNDANKMTVTLNRKAARIYSKAVSDALDLAIKEATGDKDLLLFFPNHKPDDDDDGEETPVCNECGGELDGDHKTCYHCEEPICDVCETKDEDGDSICPACELELAEDEKGDSP